MEVDRIHAVSRRELLRLAAAAGALALGFGVRTARAQAAGPGVKVALDVRNPDLHKIISPDAIVARVAGGLWFTDEIGRAHV